MVICVLCNKNIFLVLQNGCIWLRKSAQRALSTFKNHDIVKFYTLNISMLELGLT